MMKWLSRTAFVILLALCASAVVRMLNVASTPVVGLAVFLLVALGFVAVRGWQLAGKLALLFALCLPFYGCSKTVGGGYVGVKIKMTGTDKGVNDIPVETGRIFYNPWTEDIFTYPTFMQTAKWEGEKSISFGSKEGLQISGPMTLSYSLDSTKVPAFYVQFRNDDLENFTQGYLRNVAKDAFNAEGVNYTVEEIYSNKKEELILKAKERVNKQVQGFGVRLDQFGFTKALELPPQIVASMELKIKATQDAMTIENQLRASKAEAEKQVAQAEGAARVQIAQTEGEAKARIVQAEAIAKARVVQAEAEAKANKLLADSVDAKLLQLRDLEIRREYAQKWKGDVPTNMIPGAAVPFLNLPSNK